MTKKKDRPFVAKPTTIKKATAVLSMLCDLMSSSNQLWLRRSADNRLTAATINEGSTSTLNLVVNPAEKGHTRIREFTECDAASFRDRFRLNADWKPEDCKPQLKEYNRRDARFLPSLPFSFLFFSPFFLFLPAWRDVLSLVVGNFLRYRGLETTDVIQSFLKTEVLTPWQEVVQVFSSPLATLLCHLSKPGNDRCAGCHRERGWLVRLTVVRPLHLRTPPVFRPTFDGTSPSPERMTGPS